mgnify:CR=1 FL=1
MKQVTFGEALGYGLSMVAYFSLVGILSFFFIITGFAMIGDTSSPTDGERLGALIAGLGFVISAAGIYGAFYKVIADGVQTAISRNNT